MKKQKPVIEIVLGAIYTVAFIEGLLLWKLKRWLFRLAIIIFVVSVSLAALQIPMANAPKATAALNGYQYESNPTTEHQQIINYIYDTFGKDADNAFKILSLENHALRPDAQNYNSDGSVDIGIFQVNSIHGVPAQYLYDWKSNISIAYHIFKDSGWGAWTAESYYKVLEK